MSVRTKVTQAFKRGELVRPPTCEECGEKRIIYAHHDDYLKPLEIRWLCGTCHMRWHRINGRGLNAEFDLNMHFVSMECDCSKCAKWRKREALAEKKRAYSRAAWKRKKAA